MDTEIVNYIPPQAIGKNAMHIGGIPDSLVDAARTKLIQLLKEEFPELDIEPNQVILERFQHVLWTDSSIGCPQDGHFYSQVVTPGYTIGFQIGENHYTMHTDATGALIVRNYLRSF